MKVAIYTRYRRTDSRWIDEVPNHWRVEKLKFVACAQASNVDKHSHDDEVPIRLCNYSDVYKSGRITADLPFMEATASEKEIEKFSLRAGDVIITKDSESWNDIAVPAYVPQEIDGVLCGYHLSQIRSYSNELDGAYLYYLLKSQTMNRQFQMSANGVTRFGLQSYYIENATILIPPLDEQSAIVRFLDAKTTQIDKLIARKEHLLQLLRERREAITAMAVTQGLDGAATMKNSGVPWLGAVPSHWRVKRLKFLARLLQTGPFGSQLHQHEYIDGGRPIINPANIVQGKMVAESKHTVDEDVVRRLARHALQIGDVIIGRRGELGRAAVTTPFEEGWICGTGCLMLRLNEHQISPHYAVLVLGTANASVSLELSAVGTTMNNLSSEIIGDFVLPVPPLHEQDSIVLWIATQQQRLLNIEGAVTDAIAKLHTYRQIAITAAVTGQIDVRSYDVEIAAQ